MNWNTKQLGANVWAVWRALGILLLIFGFIGFFGGMFIDEYYAKNRPSEPAPEQGRVYEQDDHGRFVYLTKYEHTLEKGLIVGGWVIAACGMGAITYSKRLDKQSNK